MKNIHLLFSFLLIFGCRKAATETSEGLRLKFLDEFVLPADLMIDSTSVGGLSGIDYHNDIYYLVCDDASNARIYEAQIAIENAKITKVDVQKVWRVKDTTYYLDMESIRYNLKQKRLMITSEGFIKKQKNPLFFNIDSLGNLVDFFEIPEAFKAGSRQKPRHNGTLEGLSMSFDNKGYWIAMELPLEADGPEPQLTTTDSPVRITYIEDSSRQTKKQFAYKLGPIRKKPKEDFAVNGLTEILVHDENKFFVIERGYSSGLGNQGNAVKIFEADVSEATNILSFDHLKDVEYIPVQKKLLFDFETVRNKLTDSSVDNIEGITFGPRLKNGNKTLILVADNNFNKLGKQLNQFILLEILD